MEEEMQQLLLAGTALLAIAASQPTAHADPIVFDYTGSLVNFTVPTTGTYQILAFGAQGGTVTLLDMVGTGGRGAEIGGDFSLTTGEMLQIAVGGSGGRVGLTGGGGGGSFVVGPGNAPLVIAGGGGGAGQFSGLTPGQGGLTGPDGGAFIGSSGFGVGGTNGNGGGAGFGFGSGGGGGGFLSAGGSSPNGGTGGGAFPDLTGGSLGGGFGGGGGSSGGGAGGGGGYSGGGGGTRSAGVNAPGGGGGSFDAGTGQIPMTDFQIGNGEVIITELVPEPASIALLGVGLVSLMTLRRRRVRR
jgi:hypothetical protein